MKRIKSAVLQQKLKFILSDKLSHNDAIERSKQEAEEYIRRLDADGVKYTIISQGTDEDGAFIIEIKRQYGTAPVGDYL